MDVVKEILSSERERCHSFILSRTPHEIGLIQHMKEMRILKYLRIVAIWHHRARKINKFNVYRYQSILVFLIFSGN
jgi:hypothetical protein